MKILIKSIQGQLFNRENRECIEKVGFICSNAREFHFQAFLCILFDNNTLF